MSSPVDARSAAAAAPPEPSTGTVEVAVEVAVGVTGLAKSYAGRRVVDGVDLTVPAGRVHALLGPNGAGKTTVLRILLGLTRPDAGTVTLLGGDVEDARRRPLGGLAGFVDDPRFFPYLSARANLRLLAELDGPVDTASLTPASLTPAPPTAASLTPALAPPGPRAGGRAARRDRVDRALAEAGLADRADDRVGTYSLGMRQRLGLAAALLRRPGVLVLDEPANGLDPAGAQALWATVRRLAAVGTAVVLSSHDLGAVDEVADDVTVMREGTVVWTGPLAVLRTHAPEPEHRLVTTDDPAAARIAAAAGLTGDGLTGGGAGPTGGADRPMGATTGVGGARDGQPGLVVHATRPALAALTVRLGRSGIGVLSLTPGTSPLRALFTALTSGDPLHLPAAPPDRDPDRTSAASTTPAPTRTAPTTHGIVGGVEPGPRPGRGTVPSSRALFAAACRTEVRRLVAQTRVRLLVIVCLLAPLAFAAVVRGTGTLPADTLYGRWLLESAAAEPLVVLAFTASWAFPLLGSVVAGDLLAAEDRLGTWPTLLTRSCGRGAVLGAKGVVAAVSAVLALVVLAGSATVSGHLLAGRSPLIGLSGQVISPGAADRVVLAAWAGSVPTVLAWTAVALLLSAWTRSAIVGIAGPAVLGVLGQLATLVDGPPALRAFLPTSTLEAWHGLAEVPADPRQLLTGILVGAAWALAAGAGLATLLARRAAVDAVGAGRGRGGA